MNILMVEEDPGLNNGIVLSLKKEDYEFVQAYSLSEAREKRKSEQSDREDT